jgi:hypothetical protein
MVRRRGRDEQSQRRDVNGMTVQRYGQTFSGGGPQVAQAGGFQPTNTPAQSVPGGLPQVAQGDQQTGMPPQPTPQGVQGPAITAPPPIPRCSARCHRRPWSTSTCRSTAQAAMALAPRRRQRLVLPSRLTRQGVPDARTPEDAQYQQKLGDYQARRNNDIQQPQQNVQNEAEAPRAVRPAAVVKDYRKANTCSARPWMRPSKTRRRPT